MSLVPSFLVILRSCNFESIHPPPSQNVTCMCFMNLLTFLHHIVALHCAFFHRPTRPKMVTCMWASYWHLHEKEIQSLGSKVKRTCFKHPTSPLVGAWPWARHLNSLKLGFLVCKMKIITVLTSQLIGRNREGCEKMAHQGVSTHWGWILFYLY